MIVTPARVRGLHSAAFRSGEWGNIIGVAVVTPDVDDIPSPRACFITCFSDGVTDYIPISEVVNGNYEIVGLP